MKRFDLNVSTKNIGMPSWTTYEKKMIESIEDLSATMRWTLFHHRRKIKEKSQTMEHSVFMNDLHDINQSHTEHTPFVSEGTQENTEFYNLRSSNEAPFDPDLKPFEDDMCSIITILKKRNFRSPFQSEIKNIE